PGVRLDLEVRRGGFVELREELAQVSLRAAKGPQPSVKHRDVEVYSPLATRRFVGERVAQFHVSMQGVAPPHYRLVQVGRLVVLGELAQRVRVGRRQREPGAHLNLTDGDACAAEAAIGLERRL